MNILLCLNETRWLLTPADFEISMKKARQSLFLKVFLHSVDSINRQVQYNVLFNVCSGYIFEIGRVRSDIYTCYALGKQHPFKGLDYIVQILHGKQV